jgi:flagellar hook-associated protein 3 FlgL
MTRVATAAQNALMQSYLFQTQSRVADTQISISSGLIANDYSKIAPDVRRLVSLESDRQRTTGYVDANRVADQRLTAMEGRIRDVFQVVQDLRTELTGALNVSGADRGAIAVRAQGLLQQVSGLLNSQVDGRHLFAGTRTDVPPVNLADPDYASPPPTYPSSADTSYYQGDSTKLVLQADKGVSIPYGITADDPALEKVIRALHLTGTAATGGDLDYARGTEALSVADQALEELTVLMSKVGAARNTLEKVSDRHADYLVYLDQAVSEIEATDVPEAMTRLSQDTVALQASYAVLSRLANLSLADFLR